MPLKPIRIFLGTEPKTLVAERVLAHSIRRNTEAEVEITPMVGPGWEYPIKGIKVGTGFSLRRFMIPAACGWDGCALYMDADQVVFGDVAELWDLCGRLFRSSPGAVAATTYQPDKYYKQPAPQTSVMALDCEAARGRWGFEIDKILAHLRGRPDRETYAKFMHVEWLRSKPLHGEPDGYLAFVPEDVPEHPLRLPVEWNHLNKFVSGQTKLLHYTKEDEQPWYKPDHPLAKHWRHALQLALDAGEVTQEMLRDGLAAWGKKQDWRPTNGLHPFYRRYLKS